MNQFLSSSKLTKVIIFVFGFVAFSFLSASQADAILYEEPQYYLANPYFNPCSNSSGCSPIAECWNSSAPGVTDCGTACFGGDAWTKYSIAGCYRIGYDPWGVEKCATVYTVSGTTCSTADKCVSGPYLNAGYCNCDVGAVYKTCCDPGGSTDGACGAGGIQDTSAPPEGVCPGGSITVMCGVDAGTCAAVIPLGYQCTTNPCGPSACAILASPSPSPSSSPAPSPSPGESPAPSPSAPPPRPCDWCTNEAFCSSSGGTFYSDIWDYCAVDGDGVCCVDGGLTRYSCSGTSCVADPDGPYSNSGCDGSCSDPKPCVECIVWDAYDPPGKDGDMICLSFKRPDISADCGWCASSDPPQPDWDDCWNIDPPPSYCESNEVTWCWCQPQCQSSGTVIYFDPVSPDPGQEFYVKVESNTGYTYVGLTGTDGAGNAISPLYIGWFPGAGYTNQWRWQIQDAVAGTYNLNFTINKADSACPGDNPCQTGSVLVAGPSPSPSPASAWIQVDGDVHSNTGIDTPRGP